MRNFPFERLATTCFLFTIPFAACLPQNLSLPPNLRNSSLLTNLTQPITKPTPSVTADTGTLQTSPSSPVAEIGLGSFQLMDENLSSKKTPDTFTCYVMSGGVDVLGCKDSVVIGNNYCINMEGRHSAPFCDGVVTVDFPPQPNGPTYIHYTAPNGTYTGCTVPDGKTGGSSCINNQLGEGSFGSPSYVGDWCVVDITQWQKADPDKPADNIAAMYSYAISIYDSDTNSTASDSKNGRNLIASTKEGSKFYGPAESAVNVDFEGTPSKLPGLFFIRSGNIDADPYTLSYHNPYLKGDLSFVGNETFNAYDTTHQCSLSTVLPKGGPGHRWEYGGGKRLNTCGFAC